tara:strand:+ start:843 stop:3284 length:2442 start_codon:yes stop_codon:yes gene_type:complete
MERQVQLYIEGERVELFQDEKITINSTIQNVQDISKIYTDFTQSFSIPASPSNNIIMRHFYNSEVILYENEFLNPATRRGATIEIDGTFFRRGKIQLEKAMVENGEPYSYQITFYGDLVSLKDTFGEKKLTDLDWTSLNHEYTYDEVKDRIEDGVTDYDVRYPLVSPSRYWQYDNSTTPDDNIDTTGGAIVWSELFPAIKIKTIFEIFESQFGITFTGAFLDDPKFLGAFGYFKNKAENAYITPPIDITFDEVKAGGVIVAPPYPYTWANTGSTNNAIVVFDDTDNSIEINYVEYYNSWTGSISDIGTHYILGMFTNTSPNNTTYYIDCFRGNQLYNTIEATGGGDQSLIIFEEVNTNNPSINSKVYFRFRSEVPMTLDVELRYYMQGVGGTIGIIGGLVQVFCDSIITENNLDIGTSAPDVKVADYFANILKLFNLTAYGTEQDVYQIETIEDWYNTGGIFDITEYADMKSIDIKRIKLWKTINFQYAESKSITNRFFASTFMREYGDLTSVFDYENGEFKMNVIFENILFSKFTNTDLQVGYCIDENLKPYVPAPLILYKYTNKTVSFYLTDGVTTDEITSYVPFGQDIEDINTDYSLNWGSEISSLLEATVFGGLYNTYYKAYLENLYDPKNREVTIKTRIPLSILTQLDLNDRVIIRDKRYIINSLKTTLNTGESTMVLINDFRKMIADGMPPLFPPLKPSRSAQCLDVSIPFVKDAVSCTLAECTSPSVSGVTIIPSAITESQYVEICIPENTGADEYLATEISERITTEDNFQLITDESTGSRLIIICVVYTLSNGDQVSNQIIIEQ